MNQYLVKLAYIIKRNSTEVFQTTFQKMVTSAPAKAGNSSAASCFWTCFKVSSSRDPTSRHHHHQVYRHFPAHNNHSQPGTTFMGKAGVGVLGPGVYFEDSWSLGLGPHFSKKHKNIHIIVCSALVSGLECKAFFLCTF